MLKPPSHWVDKYQYFICKSVLVVVVVFFNLPLHDTSAKIESPIRSWGEGGTPLYGLYREVLLDRVWFLAPLP